MIYCNMVNTIKINDYVSGNKGVTPDEGQPIYDKLMLVFASGDSAVLDFTVIDMATTAFLNVVVGALYKTYTSDELKAMLSFSGISESTAFRIKKVTDNAKSFYNNENTYKESVEKVLNEDY